MVLDQQSLAVVSLRAGRIAEANGLVRPRSTPWPPPATPPSWSRPSSSQPASPRSSATAWGGAPAPPSHPGPGRHADHATRRGSSRAVPRPGPGHHRPRRVGCGSGRGPRAHAVAGDQLLTSPTLSALAQTAVRRRLPDVIHSRPDFPAHPKPSSPILPRARLSPSVTVKLNGWTMPRAVAHLANLSRICWCTARALSGSAASPGPLSGSASPSPPPVPRYPGCAGTSATSC